MECPEAKAAADAPQEKLEALAAEAQGGDPPWSYYYEPELGREEGSNGVPCNGFNARAPEHNHDSTVFDEPLLMHNRSERLLEKLVEFTHTPLPGGESLPVDFRMMLQFLESLAQQGRLLEKVSHQITDLQEDMVHYSTTVQAAMQEEVRLQTDTVTAAVRAEVHSELQESFQSAILSSPDAVFTTKAGDAGDDQRLPLLACGDGAVDLGDDQVLPLLACGDSGTARCCQMQSVGLDDEEVTQSFEPEEFSFNPEPGFDRQASPDIRASKVSMISMGSQESLDPHSAAWVSDTLGDPDFDSRSLRRSLSRQMTGLRFLVSLRHAESLSSLQGKDERYWLRRVISSHSFDWLCAVVIITNSITIGITSQMAIEESIKAAERAVESGLPFEVLEGPKLEWIAIMEKVYVAFYTIELMLKLWCFRAHFFTDVRNWKWNVFDLVLVLAGLYDVIIEISQFGNSVGITWLRILRLMKMCKMLRVIRVMRFFEVLRVMINSIAGSMMTLFWCCTLLTIIMYMFGLCFLSASSTYLAEQAGAGTTDKRFTDNLDVMKYYWCSVSQSMMTLFWAVTGGADWEPLAAPMKDADYLFYALFFFYICFCAFAVLNVLTGLFVDKAMKVMQEDEEEVINELCEREEISNFRDFFQGNCKVPGMLYVKNFFRAQDHKVVLEFLKLLEINIDDAQRVFHTLDAEKTHMVNIEEFITGCLHAKGSVSGLDMVLLMSEQKHFVQRFNVAIEYMEDRFDEIFNVVGKGQQSSIGRLDRLLEEARMNACAQTIIQSHAHQSL